jgi:hypothetical protein
VIVVVEVVEDAECRQLALAPNQHLLGVEEGAK